MNPERWEQVAQLHRSALDVEKGRRAAFLEEACTGDDALRREVESLLAYEGDAEDFLEAPAQKMVAKQLAEEQDQIAVLRPGTKLGSFEILGPLGAGGMGVVYRAVDLRLGRAVALKFLPFEVGDDPRALLRFQREARTASSLNHPNICTIYEIGEYEGQPFIVMELLEGETLRERLAASEAIPLAWLLDIAIQIAEGLEAAHEKGIIHRDIKPANVFLTKKGVVKILDFGLAKLMEAPEAQVEVPNSDLKGHGFSRADSGPFSELRVWEHAPSENTEDRNGTPEGVPFQSHIAVDSTLTRTGVAIGTAGYMSPEQVRGDQLDGRTDLFSFGLVLYEMATGQRAFSGESATDVQDAILNNPPVPVSALNSALPAKLVTTIDKALEKDRERRYQSAAEMRADLERLKRGRQLNIPELPVAGRWKLLAAAALLIAVAVAGALYWRSRHTTTLTAQDTIVLADVTNLTGNPAFDGSLSLALGAELRQTPFLNASLLSGEKVFSALKTLNRPTDTPLTPEVARELCLRTNSKALITGSIADAGNHYAIELKALNCQSGVTLAVTKTEAEDRNQVVKMLGVAGRQLREKLGEPRTSLREFNQPLEVATSPSVEALQALSQVKPPYQQECIIHAKRAVELDPNFALAYGTLGNCYLNVGQTSLAMQNYTRDYQLRDRENRAQRFVTEVRYYHSVTGELDKLMQSLTEWGQTYPANRDLVRQEIGTILIHRGQWERAAAEEEEALRLAPDSPTPPNNLMLADTALNRWQEARNTFDEARARNLDGLHLRLQRYRLAFLLRDRAQMEEQVAWAMGKPKVENWLLWAKSDSATYYGRVRNAREFLRRAVQSALKDDAPDTAAGWQAFHAWAEAEIGNAGQARSMAAEALALSAGREIGSAGALALARAGDTSQAQKMAEKLNQEFPVDTLMQNCSLPAVRAAIELEKNNPGKAVEILRTATQCEFGNDLPGGKLVPVYLRGVAYLKAGQAKDAAAEFQKIIDHPGITLNYVHGAVAHLQLGRAQAMMGDKDAARKSYQDFLTLWKDADPDVPIYKQAKAEYAKLR